MTITNRGTLRAPSLQPKAVAIITRTRLRISRFFRLNTLPRHQIGAAAA